MKTRRPNILFVVLDSARPDWLSCYTAPVKTSPTIDRIAESGIVFETCITPAVWTFPAMASVFTGMLPNKHGGNDQHQRLDSPYPTMAETFDRHGYDTAAFSDVPYVGPLTCLDRGFGTMSNLMHTQVSLRNKVHKGIGRIHRTIARKYQKTNETRVVIGEAVNWMESKRDPKRPFFLYVHSDETHAPFLPPPAYRRRFSNLSSRQMHGINQDKHLLIGGAVHMTDEDFEHLRELAYAEVAFFDAWLKRLLARLERLGELDDTIIVIMADHGDNIGDHGLLRHGLCLYDTLLHVPLIIKPPAKDAKPQRVAPMVQLIDLFPTLLGMADIEEPDVAAEFQGRDLVEAARTGEFSAFAMSELYRHSAETQNVWQARVPDFMPEYRERFDRDLRSYRTNTHKFIWSSNGHHELFDLKADPGETNNLVDAEPALAAKMRQELDDCVGLGASPQTTEGASEDPVADEHVLQRLRDLGYIE